MNKAVAGLVAGVDEPPDIETSSDGYASRFRGKVGEYLLGVQEQGVFSLLEHPPISPGSTVLDVGGGHAQLAPPLADAGYRVTVAGSDASCGLRLASHASARAVDFVACDLLQMPFADRQFDVVTSVRLMAHIDDWPRLVAELCRVADKAVIIDFPVYSSVNALSLLTFPLKKRIEKNTRTYRSFFGGEVRKAFASHGFGQTRIWRQFVLPMALHRALPRATLTQQAEGLMRTAGVTGLIGNPVLARFDREDS
ncbi:class I SAM-dependent methyltransferase [Novosphingobium sp. PY1]|uniref:class I SAM-dependent methyltransferase n=1 Tax=Novosphingobium sp. PY1 TaxID=1882221 RepID=UPI001A8CC560|nr:class I SAM-dependent methyltransferase [Novosphingobium sp. PY1]GFM28588.1 methyltransferase [Novosphingobium sp. PY1]